MRNSRVMIEEQQERSRMSDEPSWRSPAEWQCPRCAWCLCEQGLELGNGSHGICPRHAELLLQRHRAHHVCCLSA
ncbi:hypothetical protein [Ktedonospora formicarum]|uniref:hypothetical protein n=1 Tax=Ktedonospora formicarum TaxID=2778364 RepID=UPI001C68AA1C|nr:hypothetical protein [Ktedonospora formicarum]